MARITRLSPEEVANLSGFNSLYFDLSDDMENEAALRHLPTYNKIIRAFTTQLPLFLKQIPVTMESQLILLRVANHLKHKNTRSFLKYSHAIARYLSRPMTQGIYFNANPLLTYVNHETVCDSPILHPYLQFRLHVHPVKHDPQTASENEKLFYGFADMSHPHPTGKSWIDVINSSQGCTADFEFYKDGYNTWLSRYDSTLDDVDKTAEAFFNLRSEIKTKLDEAEECKKQTLKMLNIHNNAIKTLPPGTAIRPLELNRNDVLASGRQQKVLKAKKMLNVATKIHDESRLTDIESYKDLHAAEDGRMNGSHSMKIRLYKVLKDNRITTAEAAQALLSPYELDSFYDRRKNREYHEQNAKAEELLQMEEILLD